MGSPPSRTIHPFLVSVEWKMCRRGEDMGSPLFLLFPFLNDKCAGLFLVLLDPAMLLSPSGEVGQPMSSKACEACCYR